MGVGEPVNSVARPLVGPVIVGSGLGATVGGGFVDFAGVGTGSWVVALEVGIGTVAVGDTVCFDNGSVWVKGGN